MTESSNNRSFIPLLANRVYIGTYDNAVPYASATISLLSDTTNEIVVYQSQNKVQQNVTSYTTVGGVQFTKQIDLTEPFVYFTVRNNSGIDQTLMAFTVIYRISQVLNPVIIPSIIRGTASLMSQAVVNLSAVQVSTMSIYGSVSGPTVLQVQYSNDGTYWYGSQYTFICTGVSGESFGFNLSGCPYYLKLTSTNPTLTFAYINYS